MSRSRRTARDAGTRFERLVADYLAGRLGADIDRQVKTGSRDTGDIRGVSVAGRGIAIPGEQFVTMTLETFAAMLADAEKEE